MKILKIRTKNGRIITFTLEKEVDGHYIGKDLFNKHVIIAVTDIDSAHEIEVSDNV